MPALSIMIWLPAACGLIGALLPSAVGAVPAPATAPGGELRRRPSPPGLLPLLASLAALGLAIAYLADYNAGGGPQHVTAVMSTPAPHIYHNLALTRLHAFLTR